MENGIKREEGRIQANCWCTVCHAFSDGGFRLRGSGGVEVVLWLWLVPGLIYSIWRRSGPPACPECGSLHLVPSTSAAAGEYLHRFPGGWEVRPHASPPPRKTSKVLIAILLGCVGLLLLLALIGALIGPAVR